MTIRLITCTRATDPWTCRGTFPRRLVGGLVRVDELTPGICTPEEHLPWTFYVGEARAAGWAVGPNGDATCPRCQRPDPKQTSQRPELSKGGKG